jgi:hypothetical protein
MTKADFAPEFSAKPNATQDKSSSVLERQPPANVEIVSQATTVEEDVQHRARPHVNVMAFFAGR